MTRYRCSVCNEPFWGETYGLCSACNDVLEDIRNHPVFSEVNGFLLREVLIRRVYSEKYRKFIKGLEDLRESLGLPPDSKMSYGKMVALHDRVGYFSPDKSENAGK